MPSVEIAKLSDIAALEVAATAAADDAAAALAAATAAAATADGAAANATSALTIADLALPKAGGAMSGAITLAADPVDPLHAATRQYVLAQVNAAVANLLGGTPGAALDTIVELGAALASDDTDIAAINTALASRLITTNNLSDLTNAATARANLGLGSAATHAHTDYELAGAAAAAQAASQPLSSDLTAIAALTTTAYGRALLALADAAAGRTALGLGTAAQSATGDFDAAGAAAAAQAASQPLDSDLTSIAALTTTSIGRSLLAIANAGDGRTILAAAAASHSHLRADLPAELAFEDEANTFTLSQTISQNRLLKLGDAYLSSGGTGLAHLGNHAWYGDTGGGVGWQGDGVAGAFIQISGTGILFYEHNAARTVFTTLATLSSAGLAMQGKKITGLAAATANGDAVRYEQIPADPAAGTAGLRTLGTGATQAAQGSDAERAFATYRDLIGWRSGFIAAGKTAGTYLALPYNSDIINTGDLAGLSVVYLDPADYLAGTRTTKYRLRAYLLTNGTSVGTITFTFGLYPITAAGGGAGAQTVTIGTVQSGSTAAFANPATNSRIEANSGDFTAPAAGWYAIGFVVSGTTAASSRVVYGASLQMREV